MYTTKKILKDRKKLKKKSKYHTKEFKQLQMKWYKKLDNSGFNDIERSGNNRDEMFDEYGGFLKQPMSVLKRKLAQSALPHYLNLQKFAEVGKCIQILQPKLIKKPKNAHLSHASASDTATLATPATPATQANQAQQTYDSLDLKNAIIVDDNEDFLYVKVIKTITLSNVDYCILRKSAEGYTIREISEHLRSYYTKYKTSPTPRGNPYSVFYVHPRLHRLLKLMKYWLDYEAYKEELEDVEAGEVGEAGEAGEAVEAGADCSGG